MTAAAVAPACLQPIGGLLGYLVLHGDNDLAFAIVFGLVAGMMVFVRQAAGGYSFLLQIKCRFARKCFIFMNTVLLYVGRCSRVGHSTPCARWPPLLSLLLCSIKELIPAAYKYDPDDKITSTGGPPLALHSFPTSVASRRAGPSKHVRAAWPVNDYRKACERSSFHSFPLAQVCMWSVASQLPRTMLLALSGQQAKGGIRAIDAPIAALNGCRTACQMYSSLLSFSSVLVDRPHPTPACLAAVIVGMAIMAASLLLFQL